MGVFRFAVIATNDVLVLVVVRRAALGAPGRTLGACLISVEGRHLLEIVVAVGSRRTEACLRVARVSAGPLVGQEAHRVGVTIPIGLDVVGETRNLSGREEVVARDILDARGVRHAQGLDGIDACHLESALCLIDLVLAQRDERRRHLNGDFIALARVRLIRALDGDDQILCRALERIGVDVALSGHAGDREGCAVDLGAAEVVDLHEIAQGVGKRDVAGLVRAKPLLNVGGIACPRGDGAGNAAKDLLELRCRGRRLVVAGILCARAERAGIERCGERVVARHRVHEPVLFARAALCGIVSGRGPVKDADGVDGGTGVLHRLSGRDGAGGNVALEAVVTGRRTIGKEDDDFLCVRASVVRKLRLCELKTIVGTRGARGANRVDGVLEACRSSGIAGRKPLHDLRVVMDIATAAVAAVAHTAGLVAREFDD